MANINLFPPTLASGAVDYKKGVKHLVDTVPNMKKLPSQFLLKLDRNPLSVRQCQIPVIDLSRPSVEAISSACAEWGFFRVVNHGIEMSLIEEMLQVLEDFFNLRVEEKMRYSSDDVLSPVRYGTSLNTPATHSLHWRDYLRHYGRPVEDTFHLKIANQYLTEVWEMTMKISSAMSEGLGLDSEYIERSLGKGIQILAANLYPPCPEPDKTLGLAAHSDHGGLTILTKNGVDGLQVKYNQEWIAVPHVPGTFVINLGDYLEILSNGKYKSVEHRAVVNAQRARISVAVGHGPELTAVVKPASPLLQDKEAARYCPIVYKDYIKLQQSTTIRGKSAVDVLMTKND